MRSRFDPSWRLNSIVVLSVLLGLNLHDLFWGDRNWPSVAVYATASLICLFWIAGYVRELRAEIKRGRSVWIRVVDDPESAHRLSGEARRLKADVEGFGWIDVPYVTAQEAPESIAVMITNALGATAYGGTEPPDWAKSREN